MSLRNTLIRNTMRGVLAISAALARRPSLRWLSDAWARGLAALTVRMRGIRPQTDVAALGRTWQRSFPSAKQVPITGADARTVYAEIHTPCPLRGSGDVHACHRMMEYDRAVMRHAGAQFIVLRSQAEPGVTRCQVAMRPIDATIDDLVPAHARAPLSTFS